MDKLNKRAGNLFSGSNVGGYFYKATVEDGVTSDPVIIPPQGSGYSPISVSLITGSNTGKIQVTISPIETISAETAVWIDWDKGNITGTDVDVLIASVTAIRCISISGAVDFEILI